MKYALLSVSDKTGLVPLARGLADLGYVLLSTGGTARALREAGLAVTDVSEFTGEPEILGGRVKTLHPKVHAGILRRRGNPDDDAICDAKQYPPIDLVCVNLYPFETDPRIEQIDIGGPTLLRAAAKNSDAVLPVCDPADYSAVLDALAGPAPVSPDFRRGLARKVFARISAYDAAIAAWFADASPAPAAPGASATVSLPAGSPLRYGENPHQQAVFVPDAPPPPVANLATARVLHGKEMSYNNYVDADAALETVRELWDAPAAVVIKHNNPCGAATAPTLSEALAAAWEGDIVSAYGSVIALSRPVDLATAEVLKGRFVEALVAPAFEPDALEFLCAKSAQIRLVSLDAPLSAPAPRLLSRRINGATLWQTADADAPEQWDLVTTAPFPDALRPAARFGIRMCAHLKSNAILLALATPDLRHASILGMGAGQPNRVDAMRKLALPKAEENRIRLGIAPDDAAARTVLVSDAFFPFADNIEAAAAAGIRHIVAPGGSKRDAECIDACNQHGIAMVFTHCRHFLH